MQKPALNNPEDLWYTPLGSRAKENAILRKAGESVRRAKASMATILMSGTALILSLVLLTVGVLLYRSSRQSIQRQTIEQYSRVFGQLDAQLTASVKRVTLMAAALNNNTELIGASNLASTTPDASVRAVNENAVKSILKTAIGYQPYIDNAGIYLKGQAIMMFGADSTEYQTRIPAEPWFQAILSGEKDEVLAPGYQMRKYQFISLGKPYYRPYFLYARAFNDTLVSRNKGVLLISLEQTYLSDLFGEQGADGGAIVALLDAAGGIIFASGAGEASFDEAMLGARSLATGDTLNAGGRSRFVIRQQNESLGWSLVALIPEDVMYLELNRMQSRIVTAALAALAFGLVMILFISGMITRPFRALTQSMARAGEGDLRLSAVNSPIREIDQLAAQYDLMLGRIASLIQRIRTIEQEKRTSELQALRSQINPHFTYNTLDSIRWMAMMQNAPKVAEMISRFVKLLKLTTGRRGEFVKVSEEFEQVACYADIIRFRYNCQIEVAFDLSPEVKDARTLGLLLQPIVENSFVHGFDNFERPGLIQVSAYRDGETLVFVVRDNGRGVELPRGELPTPANQDGANLHAGIGISNVNDRIRAWFGEGYGVTFHSSPSEGASVTLTQPLAAFTGREEAT